MKTQAAPPLPPRPARRSGRTTRKAVSRPVTRAAAPGAAEPPLLLAPPPAPACVRVTFGCFQPDACTVCIAGTFNGWDPGATSLVRQPGGEWSIELLLPPGEHRYRFVIDGEWRDDPAARVHVDNPFGSRDAVRVVP